jgi:hypothetical protein
LVKLVFDVQDVPTFCEAAKSRGLDFGKVHKGNGYEFANAKGPFEELDSGIEPRIP